MNAKQKNDYGHYESPPHDTNIQIQSPCKWNGSLKSPSEISAEIKRRLKMTTSRNVKRVYIQLLKPIRSQHTHTVYHDLNIPPPARLYDSVPFWQSCLFTSDSFQIQLFRQATIVLLSPYCTSLVIAIACVFYSSCVSWFTDPVLPGQGDKKVRHWVVKRIKKSYEENSWIANHVNKPEIQLTRWTTET